MNIISGYRDPNISNIVTNLWISEIRIRRFLKQEKNN